LNNISLDSFIIVTKFNSVTELYGKVLGNPSFYRQLHCGESLITMFNCPLETRLHEAWSQHNYIMYVMHGRKTWHTAHHSYELQEGDCVFVRKGACIVEQFFDTPFCPIMFFVPDEFICHVLKTKSSPIQPTGEKYQPIIRIHKTQSVEAFFHSMVPYFDTNRSPDKALLELKFRELILTIADHPVNSELISYFTSLLQEPQSVALERIMEENFSFNLKLEEFAQLSNRSLSAFKRDFQKQFNTTPGKWLVEKRLQHAHYLLTYLGKTVGEASFESGFENPSHFSRSFRQYFGMTPASVKQQIYA
jgi:AraC-like DNA-binding protein